MGRLFWPSANTATVGARGVCCGQWSLLHQAQISANQFRDGARRVALRPVPKSRNRGGWRGRWRVVGAFFPQTSDWPEQQKAVMGSQPRRPHYQQSSTRGRTHAQALARRPSRFFLQRHAVCALLCLLSQILQNLFHTKTRRRCVFSLQTLCAFVSSCEILFLFSFCAAGAAHAHRCRSLKLLGIFISRKGAEAQRVFAERNLRVSAPPREPFFRLNSTSFSVSVMYDQYG
jgi:hypothetical protein